MIALDEVKMDDVGFVFEIVSSEEKSVVIDAVGWSLETSKTLEVILEVVFAESLEVLDAIDVGTDEVSEVLDPEAVENSIEV